MDYTNITQKISGFLMVGFLLTSCVSNRQYQEVKRANEESIKRQTECSRRNTQLEDSTKKVGKVVKEQALVISEMAQDTAILSSSNRKLNLLYNQINNAYERLLQKIRELEGQDAVRSSELSAEITAAQTRLRQQEEDLKKREEAIKGLGAQTEEYKKNLDMTKANLAENQKKVMELTRVLTQKDSTVNSLKNTVSKALNSYKDKGLSVSVKNGKVYVSVEEKLLFQSGKYAVNPAGKDALKQVADVLTKEQDVNIMVEGHTDNVAYKVTPNSVIKDNWDLSVMRATEVTKYLISFGVQNTRITAAGRGQTLPIMDNSIADGRAKNRRTEIILTPKLDQLFKILE